MTNILLLDIYRGRLSKGEIAQIEVLVERGLSSGRIAQKLNRHPATIGQYMATHGLRAPTGRVHRTYKRGGSIVVAFTAEEDAFIEALRIQRYTYAQIAEFAGKRFGHNRTAATIGIRLKMLGGSDG